MEDVGSLRLKMQSLFMGLGQDRKSLLIASTFKAIKSENYGGPKAKHLEMVISAIRDGETRPDEVLVWLGTVNWRKESVRAIRVIGFIFHLLGPRTYEAFNVESMEQSVILLNDILEYWIRPQSHVGFSHWDSPIVKNKLSTLVTYVKNKVTLLRSNRDLPLFNGESNWASQYANSFSGQERVNILSYTLPSTGHLVDAITALDDPGPVSDSEQAAFRAPIPLLLTDLKHLFLVNTRCIVGTLGDDAEEALVKLTLKEEYLALKARMLTLNIVVRGSRQVIFNEEDFPTL